MQTIHVNGAATVAPPAARKGRTPKATEPSVADRLRELIKAERDDSRAYAKWAKEEYRVREMYPHCPAGIQEAGVDRRYVPSAEKWLHQEIAEGRIEESSPLVREFEQWKAACAAIASEHINREIEQVKNTANARLHRLDRLFRRTPVKSLEDARAKLDYILRYEDFSDDGCKEVTRRLARDLKAL